jgi:hypothetical protein
MAVNRWTAVVVVTSYKTIVCGSAQRSDFLASCFEVRGSPRPINLLSTASLQPPFVCTIKQADLFRVRFMGSRPASASDLHRIERISSELSGKYGRRSTPQLAVHYCKKVFTEYLYQAME